jgi:hypothetical protein
MIDDKVQHFTNRGISHRRNVASSYIFNMVWLYSSPFAVRREAFYVCEKYSSKKRRQIGISIGIGIVNRVESKNINPTHQKFTKM